MSDKRGVDKAAEAYCESEIKRLEEGAQRYRYKVRAAADLAESLDMHPAIIKMNWGQHRIWAAFCSGGVFITAYPEIGSRHGPSEKPPSMSIEILTPVCLENLEVFDTGDAWKTRRLFEITDDLFDARFAEVPFIRERAERERYDPISVVRLLEYLDAMGIDDADRVGLERACRYVEALREKIRAVFVNGKEDFAEEAIREIR